MGWKILVLIYKGNTYTQGIDLLESLRKVVEAIIDTCLRASVHLHDVLHEFLAVRGKGTAISEINMEQELSSMDQEPPFLVFLYLRKVYETAYHG